MVSAHLDPVAPASRHEVVDVIRGFALIGVLLANMTYTAIWFATPEASLESLSSAGADKVIDALLLVFIEHKFITLFSMLFGLGLAIQVRQARARGRRLGPTYLRRMSVLWIIGVAHSTLVWSGDILQYYAVVGVVLLLISGWRLQVIVASAVTLGIFTSLLPVVSLLQDAGAAGAGGSDHFRIITEGSYGEIAAMNTAITLSDYSRISTDVAGSSLYWYLSPLWKAMLGFAIGASGLHERSPQLLRHARRMLPFALTIGVAGSVIPLIALLGWDIWLSDGPLGARLLSLPVEFATLALAVAYACAIIILWNRPTPPRLLTALAPVGRMAMTNYLTQSVIFTLMLYGIGAGLVGHIGTSVTVSICLAIYAAQVIISGLWLRAFRFGPLEWIWRSLTYLKPQPMRRN